MDKGNVSTAVSAVEGAAVVSAVQYLTSGAPITLKNVGIAAGVGAFVALRNLFKPSPKQRKATSK